MYRAFSAAPDNRRCPGWTQWKRGCLATNRQHAPPPPRDMRLPFAAILLGRLVVRLLLPPTAPFWGDAHTHRIWAQRLVELPLRRFYDATIITSTDDPRFPANLDHLPGDLWFHWVIAHLYQRFGPGP